MRRTLEAARFGVLLLTLGATAALAHVPQEVGGGGFQAGLLHPLLGPDHLLAMVAVGIWGAVLGQPLLLTLPVLFPLLMVAGAGLGIFGVAMPAVELGIAVSVAALGLAIALAWRAPLALALLIVGAFGIFHGHAHGTELPQSAAPAAYAAGFVICTGLLHLAGISIGSLWSRAGGQGWVRASGAAIATAGLVFVTRAALAG